MALQNGIVTGAQAAKLDSYPVLSNQSNDFLNGAGAWVGIDDATTTKSGLLSAADKTFISQLLSGALASPSTNATTGALEYKYNNRVILSIPVATGE